MAGGGVWFDFENTPHVLFLEPILRRVAAAGFETLVTAKPQAQTLELAESRGIRHEAIGDGNYRGRLGKIVKGAARSVHLAGWALRRGRPSLLISSSRSASLAARLAGVPAIGMLDYEHSEHRPFSVGCRVVFLPDLLRSATLPSPLRRIASLYPGLKENLYIDPAKYDRAQCRASMGCDGGSYVVVARPPAVNAHYANGSAQSLALWGRIVVHFSGVSGAEVLLSPRDADQLAWLEQDFGHLDRVRVLKQVEDGPSLIAAADLVVSGGGTMNREAAVLGVPAWSVFMGPPPHVDNCLAEEGRLRWVRSDKDLEDAMRSLGSGVLPPRGPETAGLRMILDRVGEMLDSAVPLGEIWSEAPGVGISG